MSDRVVRRGAGDGSPAPVSPSLRDQSVEKAPRDQQVVERARMAAYDAARGVTGADIDPLPEGCDAAADAAARVVLKHVQAALLDNPYGRTEAYEDATDKIARLLSEIGGA